jgi:enoyl-CoA hydratase
MAVQVQRQGQVTVVTLDRPEVRNAVDGEHARALLDAFVAFDADDEAAVAVLHGAGGYFCAGRTSRPRPPEHRGSSSPAKTVPLRWGRRG